MADFVISTVSTTAQTLATFEHGIITTSGALITTASAAVTLAGASNLTVLGTIGQGFGGGLITGAVTFPTIVVGGGGYIGNLDNTAISLTLSDILILENAGTIRGEISALSVTASDADAGVNLINSGRMAGRESVAVSVSLGTGRLNLFNSGEIAGTDGAVLVNSGSLRLTNTGTLADISEGLVIQLAGVANDRIINTGSIFGSVDLGGGDDLFDNDGGGTMQGLIDFGAGNDELIGGAGRERAMGGSGSDSMDFDAGRDIFLASNNDGQASDGNDDIDGGDGIDSYDARNISSRVVVNLNESRANGDAIGLDHIFSFENIRGGGIGDILVGDTGRNVIRGGGGNDSIAGLGGDDRLIGNDGNDTIRGGEGRDVMSGGDGIDTFAYYSITEIGSLNAFRDSITDFVAGTDEINLSVIDANSIAVGNQAFSFIGIGAFTGVAGQLRYVASALHQVTVVQGDINGDSVADFQLALFGNLTLAAGDFIL